MEKETSDILIEVTSSTSLDVCKKVLDELLHKLLEMGLGARERAQSRVATAAAAADGMEQETLN